MYTQHKGCCKIVSYYVISQYNHAPHDLMGNKDEIKVLQSMSYKHNPKESTVLTGLQERSKVYIYFYLLLAYIVR